MVRRWFSFIGKEIRGLHEAAYLLAFFALSSQLLALVRDKLLAYSFGASHQLDIYYAAFRIPDVIFASVGSLVSASILLPYFIERFEKGHKEGKSFSDAIFTVFFATIVVASAIIYISAPWLVPKIIPGFANDPYLPQLIMSVRIMLLSPLFLGLSNLFSCLTQMRHRFLVYGASPVVYNMGIIFGVLFIYPLFGISGLAIGVAFGAFLHMAIQVPFMAHEGLVPKFSKAIEWVKIKSIIFNSLPRTITLSANQLASFVLVAMASLMAPGSISVFTFAFNLQGVPLTIIGASYSSAVFPTLSKLYFQKNSKEFLDKMIVSAQHIIFWSMPLMVLFIVLRAQIVRTVLGAGKFDWADTRLTAAMLALFVVSTIAQSLIVLFVRAFYAEGKTARPLLINAISASTIVVSGYLLLKVFYAWPVFRFFVEDLLKVSGQSGTSVLMLGLAYSLGAILNLILHWYVFSKHYKGFTKPVLATMFHSFAASVIMGYAAFLSLRVFDGIFPLTKIWGVFMQGFSAGIFGLAVGVVILILLKNKELAAVWATIHHKIWKTQIPPAEVERM
ncbi:oligosaccharide flippase family protein [Patescibacteria group bacterium]|nr:oligosaccharide flippase family protein [Patescibacteria group bacterium]MDE1946724.1 oligosaccharide flippase family protein [Patescibacteria group bacterium]MDE2010973.1 oligosaccharide flippase family protein [Patescibacteria group bacterium]MDE2232816.1 oligosaccharide flippase family protein [Patescibacteria group bacterium]